jgi:ribosomal protein S18
MKSYNLIFLRNSKVILSKKTYSDWKEIQTEFNDYMSSLDFKSTEDLIEYLTSDYKISSEQLQEQVDKIETAESKQIELNL